MKLVLLINLKLVIIANSFLLNIAEHEHFSAKRYENANAKLSCEKLKKIISSGQGFTQILKHAHCIHWVSFQRLTWTHDYKVNGEVNLSFITNRGYFITNRGAQL